MVGVRRFELMTSSTAGAQDKNEDASAVFHADGSTQGIDVNGENDLSPRIIAVDENGNIDWDPDLANQTTARTTTSSSAQGSAVWETRSSPPRARRPAPGRHSHGARRHGDSRARGLAHAHLRGVLLLRGHLRSRRHVLHHHADRHGVLGHHRDHGVSLASRLLSGLLALREGCRGHPGHRHPPREQRPAHRDHLRDCSLLWTRRVCAGPYLYKPFNKHEAIANYARL